MRWMILAAFLLNFQTVRFDEVQCCPDLLSYLQGIVDRDRRMGLFVLTGFHQFGLRAGISQSLAGRVGSVELLPLSVSEVVDADCLPDSLDELVFNGGYPPIYDRAVDTSQWHAAYISTYMERDVRQIFNVRDTAQFQRFLTHLCKSCWAAG